jgi:predicted GH43/DUF377 family glycosyl hydrolase
MAGDDRAHLASVGTTGVDIPPLPAQAGAVRDGDQSGCDDLFVPSYADGRPVATLRMDAVDHGPVLLHGDGPNQCDIYSARDVWVFEDDGTYYMHYDAAGPTGWLCSLATSADGLAWDKHGTVLELGPPGSDDSGSASYGVTYQEGDVWHMFYLGTPNTSPPPDRVALPPYNTMKAKAHSAAGPWTKQHDVVPFRRISGTYYSDETYPGPVILDGDEYLQFFSAATIGSAGLQRTIGIARTRDLDGTWTLDPEPIVPLEEQIESAPLYFEEASQTWFLFTNHIGDFEFEYTDAIWVYWTDDINHWNPDDKAVVLDRNNCSWSKRVVGTPSVQRIGDRLAVYYDGAAGTSTSHMGRDIGLAWLDLPLRAPRPRPPVIARESVTAIL